MSQPAISSGVAARPILSFAGAAWPASGAVFFGAASAGAKASSSVRQTNKLRSFPLSRGRTRQKNASRYFDILHLAILVDLPGLDAVVVVDRVDDADLA